MGTNHGMPDSWDAPCDTKQVKVEIIVPPSVIYGSAEPNTITVEIPTTEVELWENKDGPADIMRIAKVLFPTEWEGESVVDKIPAFDPEDGSSNTSYARIYFKDEVDDEDDEDGDEDEEWILKHYGFIGGVGQSHATGVSKMWIYDFAEMADHVPFGASFSDPTPGAILREVLGQLNDNTPARVVDEVLIVDADGNKNDLDTTGLSDQTLQHIEMPLITTIGAIESVPIRPRSKNFMRNRDSIADAINWLATKLNAIWYFDPTPGGGRLVFDVAGKDGVLSRQIFYQDTLDDEHRAQNIDLQGISEGRDVRVIQNTALYEINPVNTVIVRGEHDRGVVQRVRESDFPLIGGSEPSGRFPVATVRASHIYEAAIVGSGSEDNAELAYLEEVDSDEIDEAIRVAKDTLRELIEDQAEGMIRTFGEPGIDPYDIIESHYTCAERYPDTVVPINYEVEEVKHYASGPKTYKCDIYVSIFIGENRISIDQAGTGMEDLQSGDFEEIGDDELERIEEELEEGDL